MKLLLIGVWNQAVHFITVCAPWTIAAYAVIEVAKIVVSK